MTELQILLRKLLNAMEEREIELAMARGNQLSEAERQEAAIVNLHKALEVHRGLSVGEIIDAAAAVDRLGSLSKLKR